MIEITALIEDTINAPLTHRRKVSAQSTFADLHIDAIDIICIAWALEEEFGFDVSDDDAERLASVADVVALVEGRVRA